MEILSSKEEILLAKEAQYCSWGDTVHYAKELKIFNRSEGIYVYDSHGTQYLDLQMWHSVANFGYKNEFINNIVKDQIDALPQLSCQYLHEEKILLAEKIAKNIEKTFGEKGRVHFNIGGQLPLRTRSRSSAIIPRRIPSFRLHGRVSWPYAWGHRDHFQLPSTGIRRILRLGRTPSRRPGFRHIARA